MGSSCLPSKIRSGLSLVYVKWSLFISQHPLIPLLKNSGVEQLCMHPGTPGCDGLKLYPIHLTLSSLYFIFFYRLYSFLVQCSRRCKEERTSVYLSCSPLTYSAELRHRSVCVCPLLLPFCPCVALDELLVLASACCCY